MERASVTATVPASGPPAEVTASAERWIARRLLQPMMLQGVTTARERCERVRAGILARDLEHAVAGKGPHGVTETWGDLFRRLYGEPL